MAFEYTLRDDEYLACGACGVRANATPVVDIPERHDVPEAYVLCELCANTEAGVLARLPNAHDYEVAKMLVHVNHVANIVVRQIVSALREKKTS